MGPKLSGNFKKLSFHAGALSSLIAAVLILAFVVSSYLEYDVVRVRGLVLSLILVGVAAIVRSEAHAFMPVQRDRQ